MAGAKIIDSRGHLLAATTNKRRNTMSKFYRFEHHTGDDNDNSINDVVVEAATKEEAQSILIDLLTSEGFKDDTGNEDIFGMKYVNDIPYHEDFYFREEHETLGEAEKARARYHGYWEVLK